LGIELNEQLACAVIRINNRRSLKKYDADEMRLFEVSLCNTINEVVNDSFKGYTFSWNPGEFVTVFSSDGGMTPEIYRQKVGEMGERLVHIVKQYFNISISIGFSNPCRGYAELHQAYLESYRAFQSSYDTEEREVAIFDELTENNQVQTKIDIIELKDLISNGIELHEQESVRIAFAKAQSVLHGPAINRERAYDLCLQLAYLIKGVSGLSETELKAIIGYDHSLYETILRLNTLVEIIDWLSGLEERICSYIHRKDETKNHRLIIKAKKYILEHYPEEFGLNEVASAINISPGYLSTIFRQYTGMCFSDYVTEVRIDQAKKLLRESDYKIYEISEMLGYQNAYYFSKVFKKITGMSPSEFSGKQM
jgi:two-component system response regulator YesN